jgi:hypothetical protein
MVCALGIGLVRWELRASRPFFDVRPLVIKRALTRTRCQVRDPEGSRLPGWSVSGPDRGAG